MKRHYTETTWLFWNAPLAYALAWQDYQSCNAEWFSTSIIFLQWVVLCYLFLRFENITKVAKYNDKFVSFSNDTTGI